MVLHQTRERVEAWVTGVLGEVVCSAEPPGAAPEADVVVYLLALDPRPELRNGPRAEPFRFGLRYLVTTQGDDAEERLGRLLEGALAERDVRVDLAPLDPATWLAFGVPPRAAFVIEVEASVERHEPMGPPVRAPLAVEVRPTRTLRGEIVGPDRIPIASARVEAVGLNSVAYTDGRGAFELRAVPEAGHARLRISARGRQFLTTADLSEPDEPLVIHCNLLEE